MNLNFSEIYCLYPYLIRYTIRIMYGKNLNFDKTITLMFFMRNNKNDIKYVTIKKLELSIKHASRICHDNENSNNSHTFAYVFCVFKTSSD